ncbi:MAG: hypothetical protein WA609_05895 [Terriglobales bacterium]
MATTNNIPRELNWVEKRAACTAAQIFNELCSGIDNDVSAINAARELPDGNRFGADMMQTGRAVAVGQYGAAPRKRVIVELSGQEIKVHDDATQSRWCATVALNDEGRCILKLEDGSEIEQWHFRKKALQALFFGEGNATIKLVV